ncbi:MAG: bifunctional DedA family/phosphatase PAP2 family protein [Nocardioidaceae bacterium]
MTSLFDGLLNVPPALVLALVFLLPAAEASVFIGVLVPGEIAILLGGVLANEQKVPLWAVVVLGFLGATVGDTIGYQVGRRYGRTLLSKLPRRLVKPEHLDRAEAQLRARGGRAVFVGRFTASLRALIPGIAGMSHLPYRRFLVFNVAGAAAWVSVVAGTGYVAGRSYRAAESRFSLISFGLLAVILGWLLYRLLRHSEWVQHFIETRLPFLSKLDAQLVRAIVVLGAATWLFAGLAQDVAAHEGLATSDPSLLADVLRARRAWLTPIARLLTDLGTGPPLFAAVLIASLVQWRRRRDWRLPVLGVCVLAAGQLVRLLVNQGLAIPRPPESRWLAPASGYAFPSGHTTSATVGYALVALLLARADPPRQRLYVAVCVVIIIGVGLSRMYLGVHWPSDVLGGWTFGVGWLALTAVAVRAAQLARRRKQASTTGI